MRPFRFNLEVLLQLRRQRTEEALGTYAKAVQGRTQAEAAVEAAQGERAQLFLAMSTSRGGRVSTEQHAYGLRLQAVEGLIQKRREELEKARALEAQTRESYLARRRDVEVLERLRTRRSDEHRKAAFKHEEQLLEDVRRPNLTRTW